MSLFIGPTGKYVNEMAMDSKVVTFSKEEYEMTYGKTKETPEDEEVIMDENQIRSLVRKSLVKLLEKPGSIKGYVQSVVKDVGIHESDDNTLRFVRDEVEQSISEMISMFRKKYKVKA
jgi:hypothetical protein